MKRLGFLLGIVILVLVLTAGYTLWLHNNTMTTYNITAPAVMLNLSNYAHDEIDINFTGNIYHAKLATNLMFSGTLIIGDVTYHYIDENVLEFIPLKGDDYQGSFVSGEGELASIIINANFTKGFIKYWDMVDAESEEYIAAERYVIFPYKGESDLELKQMIKDYENEFVKDYNPIHN